MARGKFLWQYTLLYAACIFASFGIGFVFAAATFFSGLWKHIIPIAAGIVLLSFVSAFLLALALYRKMQHDIAVKRSKN